MSQPPWGVIDIPDFSLSGVQEWNKFTRAGVRGTAQAKHGLLCGARRLESTCSTILQMSTLFEQPPRRRDEVEISELDEFLTTALELAKKHKIDISDVIAASRVLQLKRAANLYVANGDAFDEQMAG